MIYELVLFVAFFGYSVNGQVIDTANTCSSLKTNTTECQSGDKALPTGDYSLEITIDNLKDLFTSRGDSSTNRENSREAIEKACKSANKEKYKAAAVCIANSYRHCADNDFKTLIPTAEKYGEAFEFLCDNGETADHILYCLSDSFTDCVANKKARRGFTSTSVTSNRSVPFSEHKEYYCGRDEIEDECVRDDIDVQACLDAGEYDKYVELRNLLRPSACGASAIIFTTSLLFVSLIASFFI